MELDLTRALAEALLPTFGTLLVDPFIALFELCKGVHEFKVVCQALLQRYKSLWDSMQTLESTNMLPKSTVLPKFSESIGEFKLFLDIYQNKIWLNRIAAYRGVMDRITDFNNNIDHMLKVLNIDFMAESLQRQNDLALAQQDILALFQKMANDSKLVGSTVRDGSLKEPLTLLKYESRKHGDENHVPLVESTFHKIMAMARVNLPTIEEWFVSPDDINYKLEKLEDGSFGKVSRGTYLRSPVVIKLVLMDTEQERVQFFREAGIWHKLRHPHVLRLIGVCHVSTPGMFVCEDATYGNFAQHFADGKNRNLMWQLFYEASLGMVYLQGLEIVHGNLKCNNLLVGADGMAKVSDFGFAFQRSAVKKLSKKLQSEELKWKAPESIRGEVENPILKSDVYSFGMCIIEAYTGKAPFDGYSDEAITDAAFDNLPVCCPVGMSERVWALVEKMTKSDPADRVNMEYVNAELERLADEEATSVQAMNIQAPCSSCSKPMSALDKFCSGCGVPRAPTAKPQNGQVTELGEKLESLVTLCETTFENQLLCLHVTDRLREVWKQLQKIDEDQDGGVDEDIVLEALDLVATYRDFVEELLIKRENVMEQLIMEREVLAKLEVYHVKIDLLVVRLNIGKVDTWRQQWNQHHKIMAEGLRSRVTSTGNLLEQVSNCEDTLRQLDTEIGHCHDQKHLPVLQLARGIILEFLNSKCTVSITVVRATDLAAADHNGLSDPYVKLRIGNVTHTSERVKKSLNPVWPNNCFQFVVSRKNPDNLNVEVWDKDVWTSDDQIGTLCVPLGPFVVGQQSFAQEMEYPVAVPKEYAGQKCQSKLFLKIAVDTAPLRIAKSS